MAPGSGDGFDRSTDKQMDNVSKIRPEPWLIVRLHNTHHTAAQPHRTLLALISLSITMLSGI